MYVNKVLFIFMHVIY